MATLLITSQAVNLRNLGPAPTPAADMGPRLLPSSLPPSITRLCIVPAPATVQPLANMNGLMPAELPNQLLALPLVYLDVSESLFLGSHLAVALPRLTRLTSLALDKCELAGAPWQVEGLVRQAVPSALMVCLLFSLRSCAFGVDAVAAGL